jgi:LysR family transcriptional regulator, glycine cleavage system transcriptional activator
MHPIPPLGALRVFEAAARHMSLTKAAKELSVSPGAVSHQIRGLEALLGAKLFERRVRAIALTPAGNLLYPGLQTGFLHIRQALAGLKDAGNERVLVVSTSPGLTSKWLAPRLYRFAAANPEIDVRISSSLNNANFTTDGVDVAVRNMPIDPVADHALVTEKLVELSFVPVCSPRLIESHGPLDTPAALLRAPLIHDDTLSNRVGIPTWADWFVAAGMRDFDVSHGLRFNSADHALEAASQNAGVLLAHDLLAYDDLRAGRLVIPIALALPAGRALYFVFPRSGRDRPPVQAFRRWIKEELAAVDRRAIRGKATLRAAADLALDRWAHTAASNANAAKPKLTKGRHAPREPQRRRATKWSDK